MIVSKLSLRNFRNYAALDVEFSPGLNFIVGDNAEGKTNIVEAINFLSIARSWRTSENRELIKTGAEFAAIKAQVNKGERSNEINAILTPNSKKFLVDNNPIKKLSELSNLVNVITFKPKDALMFLVNVITFKPKDALMFIDSPKVRRNFLDINLSKKSPIYLENLIRYEKLLEERNKILKSSNIDKIQLDVVTLEMIKISEIIVKYRYSYVNDINRVLSKVISQLKGENEKAVISYSPYISSPGDFVEVATRAYEMAYERDIKSKSTNIGIHREDIVMMLNGKDISSYGSQGENRLAVIALKLAPYFLIEDRDLKPIIVLDDVLSELDPENKERLIAFIRKFEQVFVTSTRINIKNASILEVKNHRVTRRYA